MARPLRLEFPGAVYHLTSRGNARQDIVTDDRDRVQFVSLLAHVSRPPVRQGILVQLAGRFFRQRAGFSSLI